MQQLHMAQSERILRVNQKRAHYYVPRSRRDQQQGFFLSLCVGRNVSDEVSAFFWKISVWLRMAETKNLAALSMFVLSLADVSNLQERKHHQRPSA
jgi:hypothetical protein